MQQFAGLMNMRCQHIIFPAWVRTSAWMIMTKGQNSCILQQHFLHHQSDIDRSHSKSTDRYTLGLYETEILFHHQNPAFFNVKVLYRCVHKLIDILCTIEYWCLFHCRFLPSFTSFGVPEPIRIASNSASLSAPAPSLSSFSRGRSASAQ